MIAIGVLVEPFPEHQSQLNKEVPSEMSLIEEVLYIFL